MLDRVLSRMILTLIAMEPARMVDLCSALGEVLGLPVDRVEGGLLATWLLESDRTRTDPEADPEEKVFAVDMLAAHLVGALAERAAIVAYLRAAARHNPDCPVTKGAAALVDEIERGTHGRMTVGAPKASKGDEPS